MQPHVSVFSASIWEYLISMNKMHHSLLLADANSSTGGTVMQQELSFNRYNIYQTDQRNHFMCDDKNKSIIQNNLVSLRL